MKYKPGNFQLIPLYIQGINSADIYYSNIQYMVSKI